MWNSGGHRNAPCGSPCLRRVTPPLSPCNLYVAQSADESDPKALRGCSKQELFCPRFPEVQKSHPAALSLCGLEGNVDGLGNVENCMRAGAGLAEVCVFSSIPSSRLGQKSTGFSTVLATNVRLAG